MEEPLTVTRALSAIIFVISAMLLGFMAGGFVGGRLPHVATGEMGWGRLADALIGAALGTLAGFAGGSWGVRRIVHRRRRRWIVGLVAGAIAIFIYMQANPIVR